MTKVMPLLKKYSAVIVIVLFYAWAATSVSLHRAQEAEPGVITIRIAHQQLEPGVRQGLNELAADYQKLHPNVRIVQNAIPETTYGQWVTTQLMGGTAPDILQAHTHVLPEQTWLTYDIRYFLPVTPYVSQPNPYNKGTELEADPLRATYFDGMKLSYIEEVNEFMSVPLSMHGQRVFYNKTLLKKLTGLETPPTELRAFLAVCEKIRQQQTPSGQFYTPIAASKSHFGRWEEQMLDPLTSGMTYLADFGRNAEVGKDETFTGFRTGQISLSSPPLAAKLKLLTLISQYFSYGYTGKQRDEAVLEFSQQRAVFLSTGTWEARGLRDQAEGEFELGITMFPEISPDDPEFGPLVLGPRFESMFSLFSFAVTRQSKHPEVAIDFLRFLTAQAQNEKLNRLISWLPAIRGAKTDEFLGQFKPQTEGVYRTSDFRLGGESWIAWEQNYSAYQVGLIDFPTFKKQFEAAYIERGLLDFRELEREWRRSFVRFEQWAAGQRALAMNAPESAQEYEWLRYRVGTGNKVIWPDLLHRAPYVRDTVRGYFDPNWWPPYKHRDRALATAKARLKQRDAASAVQKPYNISEDPAYAIDPKYKHIPALPAQLFPESVEPHGSN